MSAPPRDSLLTHRRLPDPPPDAGAGLGIPRAVLVSEKAPVVVEIGEGFVKASLGGDAAPRAVIPVFDWQWRVMTEVGAVVQSFDHFVFLFERLFRAIFFHHLLINPRGRGAIIVEKPIFPPNARRAVVSVLFSDQFQVEHIYFAMKPGVQLTWTGLHTGLVVSVGHASTVVLPIVAGIPCCQAMEVTFCAGLMVSRVLRHLLLQHYDSVEGKVAEEARRQRELMVSLTSEELEDLKVQAVYATFQLHGVQPVLSSKDARVTVNRDKGEVIVPAKIRWQAAECLFRNVGRVDSDELAANVSKVAESHRIDVVSVVDAIESSLLMCPMDVKPLVVQNILLAGGTVDMIGFRRRLAVEIKDMLEDTPRLDKLIHRVQFGTPPVCGLMLGWCGGSLLAPILSKLPMLERSHWRGGSHRTRDWAADWTHVKKLDSHVDSDFFKYLDNLDGWFEEGLLKVLPELPAAGELNTQMT